MRPHSRPFQTGSWDGVIVLVGGGRSVPPVPVDNGMVSHRRDNVSPVCPQRKSKRKSTGR